MNINDYQLLVPLFKKYWIILILIFFKLFFRCSQNKKQLQQCEIFYSLLTLTRIQIRQTIDENQWPFICWLMIMKMKYIFMLIGTYIYNNNNGNNSKHKTMYRCNSIKNEWLTHWYGLHLHPRVKVITYILFYTIKYALKLNVN